MTATFAIVPAGLRPLWVLAPVFALLLCVTDWTRVVYVPTRAGYSVLLSPADPQALLQAIQRIASGG